MGNFFTCITEDVKLSSIFGSCACGKSACSCFGKEAEVAVDEIAHQINVALRVELAAVEAHMKEAMMNDLLKYGTITPIHVIPHGGASPPQNTRALTVRIKPYEPDAVIVEPLALDAIAQ